MLRIKIIFYGAYGVGNIGDEATLDVLIEKIKKTFPEAQTLAFSANPRNTELLHRIRSSKPRFFSLLKCDILVIDDLDTSYKFIFAIIGRILKKRVIYYGVGAPKLNLFMKILLPFALNVNDISVRDIYTKNLFANYGLKRSIPIIPDPAIQLKPINDDVVESFLGKKNINQNNILIGLCLRYAKNNQDTEKLKIIFVELVNWLTSETDSEVLFIPMCIHSYAKLDKDHNFAELIKGSIKNPKKFHILSDLKKPDEVKGVFKTLSVCIGMRLHSSVFAYSAGIPFIGIVTNWEGYDEKIVCFMKTFHKKQPINIDNLTIEKLKNEIIEIVKLRNRKSIKT